MAKPFQPNDCYYCKTRYESRVCTLPYSVIADIKLSDDPTEALVSLTETHVRASNPYLHMTSPPPQSDQSYSYSNQYSANPTTFSTDVQQSDQGAPVSQASTPLPALTAEPTVFSPKSAPTSTKKPKKQSLSLETLPSLKEDSSPEDQPTAESYARVTRLKAKPAPKPEPTLRYSLDLHPVATSDLPVMSEDVVYCVTFAHRLRTNKCTDITLRDFLDCVHNTIHKNDQTIAELLKDYPDILRSIARNFIKRMSNTTLQSWKDMKPLPHPDISLHSIVNTETFGGTPPSNELSLRLDNLLVRHALIYTYSGKIGKTNVPTYLKTIEQQLSDLKSERLFQWLQRVRKDSKLAYQSDTNFYKVSDPDRQKLATPETLAKFKHACPTLSPQDQDFLDTTLTTAVQSREKELTKFKLPTVPGYTETELMIDLTAELIAHFPTWQRPNFSVSPSQVSSICEFLQLKINTSARTTILWALNDLLPVVKSYR